MRTGILWLTIFFVVILFGFESAKACSCRGGANPCGFYRAEGGVAFIGTVTNVVDSNEKYGQPIKGKARKITIKVNEIFKGTLPNEIITSDDGFQCDNFPFKLGQSYLVYSKGILENTENILPVGLCSGTAPIDKAQDSINFLRQMKNGVMPSVLYGKVQRVINGEKYPYQELPKTKIVLTKKHTIENGQYKKPKKKERTLETFTDEKGEFKFENLEVGIYKLSAVLPNDLWMAETREISTGGAPSCDFYPLYAFTNGSISGNVVNANGTPARLAIKVSLIDSNTKLYYTETRTDEKGNYTFSGLNEGRYKIDVSLSVYSLDGARTYPFENYPHGSWYYPNTFENKESEIITLGYSQKISGINLKMPLIPTRQSVSGILVWEDGTPVNKGIVVVRTKNVGNGYQRNFYAKEDGTFSFETFDGVEYEISAWNNTNEAVGSADWSLLDKKAIDSPLKLVLKSSK